MLINMWSMQAPKWSPLCSECSSRTIWKRSRSEKDLDRLHTIPNLLQRKEGVMSQYNILTCVEWGSGSQAHAWEHGHHRHFCLDTLACIHRLAARDVGQMLQQGCPVNHQATGRGSLVLWVCFESSGTCFPVMPGFSGARRLDQSCGGGGFAGSTYRHGERANPRAELETSEERSGSLTGCKEPELTCHACAMPALMLLL